MTPTSASHKEKPEDCQRLEVNLSMINRDQFVTESSTETNIYPCLQYSYKRLKRNISIHYMAAS